MEKLRFEIPSIERKEDALEYIKEFKENNSQINGVGGLDRYFDNYEGWLEKLENDYNIIPNEERVPGIPYFLDNTWEHDANNLIYSNFFLVSTTDFLETHQEYSKEISRHICPRTISRSDIFDSMIRIQSWGKDTLNKASVSSLVENHSIYRTIFNSLNGENSRKQK